MTNNDAYMAADQDEDKAALTAPQGEEIPSESDEVHVVTASEAAVSESASSDTVFHEELLEDAPEESLDAFESVDEASTDKASTESDGAASDDIVNQDADCQGTQDETPQSTTDEEAEEGNPFNLDVPDTARWYIVHTYSGFELRVEQTINEMIRNGQAQGLIYQVVVPTERVEELGKGGEKRTAKRKFYPGYIMVQMTMTDYSWHVVQTIPKVTGFVGGKNRPTPMRDSEADRILQLMRERQEKPRPKFSFDRGDDVRVIDGPFGGFNGVVDEVNYDKGKLKVSVSIFGRQTPVELDFVQVSKG